MDDRLALLAFATNLEQELLNAAELEEDGRFRSELFTQYMLDTLIQAGELDEGVPCYHRAHGMEVSGYGVSEDEETLSLFVTLYRQEVPPATVGRTEVDSSFRRLRTFLDRSMGNLYRSLEEASPVFDMSLRIHEVRPFLSSVRLFLLTDGITTIEHKVDEDLDGIQVSFHVWDMRRLHRCVSSGQHREPIEIDFVERFGGAVPCLSSNEMGGDYSAYLLILGGDVLSALYGEFGPRLLELNVRSFLQARGKVNQGIRKTIMDQPERFLAYNNGISATASYVELVQLSSGGQGIKTIKDLQIVNGGQTTASLFHVARKDRANVSGVRVQAKLTVVSPRHLTELVPLISRYANTQNKVNEADFSANDPFHVKLESLSRSVWAPATDGTQRQTKWFYERARGQYQDAVNRESTPSKQRQFKATYPNVQRFTKTDLAKYENTWAFLPYTVSQGAEKNFREFTMRLAKGPEIEVDPAYFRHLVAKAIMFRSAEKIVALENFGGYRANIVTYTLAYIAEKTKQRLDLDRIWQKQAIGEGLADAIRKVAIAVHHRIINPPGGRNVTEWCKRRECWELIRSMDVQFPSMLADEILEDGDERNIPRKASRRGPRIADEELLGISQVAMVPARVWERMGHWAAEMEQLTSAQRSLAFTLMHLARGGKQPTSKQAADALRMLREAEGLGFRLEYAVGMV